MRGRPFTRTNLTRLKKHEKRLLLVFAPDKLDAIFKEIDSSPELSKKFQELMDKKKEDWRAREADRKLVG